MTPGQKYEVKRLIDELVGAEVELAEFLTDQWNHPGETCVARERSLKDDVTRARLALNLALDAFGDGYDDGYDDD